MKTPRSFFQEKNRKIETRDKVLWKEVVHNIVVDKTMQVAPKVEHEEPEDSRGVAQKRRARDQDGPVGATPNSAERKLKVRRHQHGDVDHEVEQAQDTNMDAPSNEGLATACASDTRTEEDTRQFTPMEDTVPPPIPRGEKRQEAGHDPCPHEGTERDPTKRRVPMQQLAPNVQRSDIN